jgi:hypothetical protein
LFDQIPVVGVNHAEPGEPDLSSVLFEVVNVASPAVVPPMVPGDENVAPFSDEAFRFGTFVVDEIINGASPVVAEDLSCEPWTYPLFAIRFPVGVISTKSIPLNGVEK